MNSIYVPTSVPTTPLDNRGKSRARVYNVLYEFYANFSFVKEVYGMKIHETKLFYESTIGKTEIRKIISEKNTYHITKAYYLVLSQAVPNIEERAKAIFESEGVYTKKGFRFEAKPKN